MCEATAFKVLSDTSEEKIMESVTKVQIEGDRILIDDLFGDRKEIIGVIREINLVKNRIDIISV